MTTGQKSWSSSNQEVKKFENVVLPLSSIYDFENLDKWEVKKSENGSRLFYVNGRFKTQYLGKDVTVFHMFFLDTSPSKKDNVAMVNREGGIVQFSKALGIDLNVDLIECEKYDTETGESFMVDILDPNAVCSWLNNLKGERVQAKIKHDTNQNTGAKINKISSFMLK